MKESVFHKTAAAEAAHWWFVGRRAIVRSVLEGLALPPSPQILEAGCGCGGNLSLLAEFGRVFAFDPDPLALGYSAGAEGVTLAPGDLPDGIPFAGESFDLCVLLDVLEHLERDRESLRALGERLNPGGSILATVPANPFLWSDHDRIHHHRRRYTRGVLGEAFAAAGLRVDRISHFNTLLFPAVALVRGFQTLFPGRTEDELDVPPAVVNRPLASLFRAERHLVRTTGLPFGVSLLIVGSRESR